MFFHIHKILIEWSSNVFWNYYVQMNWIPLSLGKLIEKHFVWYLNSVLRSNSGSKPSPTFSDFFLRVWQCCLWHLYLISNEYRKCHRMQRWKTSPHCLERFTSTRTLRSIARTENRATRFLFGHSGHPTAIVKTFAAHLRNTRAAIKVRQFSQQPR